jgi:hypothetical protein
MSAMQVTTRNIPLQLRNKIQFLLERCLNRVELSPCRGHARHEIDDITQDA